jgi:hypothetical protein
LKNENRIILNRVVKDKEILEHVKKEQLEIIQNRETFDEFYSVIIEFDPNINTYIERHTISNNVDFSLYAEYLDEIITKCKNNVIKVFTFIPIDIKDKLTELSFSGVTVIENSFYKCEIEFYVSSENGFYLNENMQDDLHLIFDDRLLEFKKLSKQFSNN